MEGLLQRWSDAAVTSTGLFWMAFWAFGLGYLISSMIQVFVTRRRMRQEMGEAGARSVGLGTFFGFISSSCSFAALSTSRALFARGAGLIPSLAFLLASTNLVVELGLVIALFLSWQFVVAEYIGGLLLIGSMWILVKLTLTHEMEQRARERAQIDDGSDDAVSTDEPFSERLRDLDTWGDVAEKYFMEWEMVWKDVVIGFTVAGVIAAFVPAAFFEQLFIGSAGGDPAFWQVVAQSVIGPVAAFFTFIGSMGNIPLAAVLFGSGVSFAGVVAFIFSDLVVFPVLRILSKYYGWKFALYIAGIFMACIVFSATALHYGFDYLGYLPSPESFDVVKDRDFFTWDYSAILNIGFLVMSAGFVVWKGLRSGFSIGGGEPSWTDRLMTVAVVLAFIWLAIGSGLAIFGIPSGLA